MQAQLKGLARFWSVGTLLFALILSGCTHRFESTPDPETPHRGQRLDRTIAVYFSPEFREYKYTHPTGVVGLSEFHLGSSSVHMFRAVFEELFGAVLEADTASLHAIRQTQISDIIEVNIRGFDFNYESIHSGINSNAEIAYSFSLRSRGRESVREWSVKGRGKAVNDFEKTAKLAMEDAARTFVRGFRQIAEKHWGPEVFEYAAVAEAPRITSGAGAPHGFGSTAVAGVYEGTVTVIADPYIESSRQASEFPGLDLRKAQVIPIRVYVKNAGASTLETHRSSIVMRLADGREVEQLDDDELHALMTPYYGRMHGPILGPGVLMLPLLFASLANVAKAESEAEAGRTGVAALDARAFEIASLDQGAVADGFVYFSRRGFDGPIRDATLVVPVADVGEKKVYSVDIPLRGPTQKIMPYRTN